MALVPADWEVTRSTKNIRYIGDAHGGASPSYSTVIDFHRWLQDLADDAVSSGDDEVDITDQTPSDRSTDNIITLLNGYNIDQTAAEHLYDGSISQNGGDDIWAGLVVVGAVPDGTTLQIISNNAFYDSEDAPYWGATSGGEALNGIAASNIIMETLVPVKASGTAIDGQRFRVQAREFGDTYAEFSVTAGLGNNVAAIFTAVDLNNQTAEATVGSDAAFTDIVNDNEGYVLLDVNQDATDEAYYSQWDLNGRPINNLYERAKWFQARTSATRTLYGLDGGLFRGITHQFNYDAESGGPFTEPEEISWTGGTGQLLAIFDNGTTGTIWMQLLTGTTPGDNVTITGATSSATCLVDGSVTARTVSAAFIGQSTGSALIGAFGVGVDPADLTAADLVFDLTNTPITPPNQVQFAVGGLVASEDRILVGPESGGALDVAQMSLNAALTGAAVTSIVMAATIPDNTPNSGTIRVEANDGRYLRVPYTSFTGSTFTIPSFDFSGSNNCDAANNAWVSYIDKLAASSTETVTIIYDSDDTFFVRARDGGGTPIKTFETTAAFGAGGGATTVIRTSDA
jgi:hypothetical protein